jgi:predicted lipoprotein with Yx(FWY)xxD motif
MRKLLTLAGALVAVLAVSGCGAGGAAPSGDLAGARGGPPILSAEEFPGIGEVLVDEGVTLYVFAPDRGKEVTCAGECAAAWPPLTVRPGQRPQASGTVRQRLIGTVSGPEGEVATYAGWPLYTFVSDTELGEANGQGVDLNGGHWYVISPAGKVIK